MEIPKNWTFDSAEVADHFDEHVVEQLPWYNFVTNAVAHVVRHYLSEGGSVVDVGASTGNVGRAIADTLGVRLGTYLGIEKSAMAWSGPGRLIEMDAREFAWEKEGPFDVAVFFLTVMFVPPRDRRELLRRAWERVTPGGAMIVVDRTPAVTGYPATVLWRLALAGKMAAGASPADVVAKELSLAGVQRPIDPAILPGSPVEFFRFGDFAGWLIERPER